MTWEAVGLLLLFFVGLGGLNLAGIRLLFTQHEKTELERLDAVKKHGSDFAQEMARDLLALKADLTIGYVRREDWIRFGTVIDAKIDTIRQHVESVREKLYGPSQS